MRLLSLVRLEARKIRTGKLILLTIPITMILLFSTFISIFGVNQDHASSFAAIFKMMTSTVWDFYLFYTAFLISKIIVEEYVNHTVMILFTYSIKRARIFLAKILLTSMISLICQFFSQVICFAFVVITDKRFSLVNGFLTKSNCSEFWQYVMIDLLAAEAAVLFISAVAIMKKSVSSVFLYGIGFLFFYQVIINQINSFPVLWGCYLLLLIVCAAFYAFSAHHWMNRLKDS
jgi:ABC-type transport system involved in multi-copper enzyme maturation permease subunit